MRRCSTEMWASEYQAQSEAIRILSIIFRFVIVSIEWLTAVFSYSFLCYRPHRLTCSIPFKTKIRSMPLSRTQREHSLFRCSWSLPPIVHQFNYKMFKLTQILSISEFCMPSKIWIPTLEWIHIICVLPAAAFVRQNNVLSHSATQHMLPIKIIIINKMCFRTIKMEWKKNWIHFWNSLVIERAVVGWCSM